MSFSIFLFIYFRLFTLPEKKTNSNCCTAALAVQKVKVKYSPYSLPSVGPGADPGVQAVSPQVTWNESRHRPSSRLPLLSARHAVTRGPLGFKNSYMLILIFFHTSVVYKRNIWTTENNDVHSEALRTYGFKHLNPNINCWSNFVYFLFLHCAFICVPSCTNFIIYKNKYACKIVMRIFKRFLAAITVCLLHDMPYFENAKCISTNCI